MRQFLNQSSSCYVKETGSSLQPIVAMLQFSGDMEILFLVAKILIVAFFLVMFLRGNKLIWGIGLLTVTTAILLDTFLNTFGREEMLAQLGFFYYAIIGGLFAGGAAWVWMMLRPVFEKGDSAQVNGVLESDSDAAVTTVKQEEAIRQVAAIQQPGKRSNVIGTSSEYDRQEMIEKIYSSFGQEDILDLIFDLEFNENDIIGFNQDSREVIVKIVDLAEEREETGDLVLAVERILTPVPADRLPRLEKLDADSPPTILRHYLLANYSQKEVEKMAINLGIDWDNISGENKQSKIRYFLLYLDRRSRTGELIDLMKNSENGEDSNLRTVSNGA